MTMPADRAAADLAASALAHVLDLPETTLRADTPLADIGADSVALIQWADLAEELAAAQWGAEVRIEDSILASARTLGDLTVHLAAQCAKVAP